MSFMPFGLERTYKVKRLYLRMESEDGLERQDGLAHTYSNVVVRRSIGEEMFQLTGFVGNDLRVIG